MYKPLLTLLSGGAVLLLGLLADPAAAQALRPSETFYLKSSLGLSTYGGDRNVQRLGGGYAERSGPGIGLELGYRTRMGSLHGSLGAYYLLGRYPRIDQERAIDVHLVEASGLGLWRHTLALMGQVDLWPSARFSPYLRLGAGTTAGFGDGARLAFSPIGGLGLDVALTERAGLFVEASGILALPDEGLDQAEGLDDRDVDVLQVVAVGVRIGLNRPLVPVQLQGIEGPTRLTTGEEATFTARANNATPPITYRWSFGDGATATGPAVTHRFDTPGNYTLTLRARSGGSTDAAFLTVNVSAPTPPVSTGPADAEAPPEADEEAVVRYDEVMNRPPASADEETCAEVTDLEPVFFGENSSVLDDEGRQALRQNLDVLRQCTAITVRVEGFITPSERSAQQLAQGRVRTVQQFYTEHGLAADRIVSADVTRVEGVTSKDDGRLFRRVNTIPVPGARSSTGGAP